MKYPVTFPERGAAEYSQEDMLSKFFGRGRIDISQLSIEQVLVGHCGDADHRVLATLSSSPQWGESVHVTLDINLLIHTTVSGKLSVGAGVIGEGVDLRDEYGYAILYYGPSMRDMEQVEVDADLMEYVLALIKECIVRSVFEGNWK